MKPKYIALASIGLLFSQIHHAIANCPAGKADIPAISIKVEAQHEPPSVIRVPLNFFPPQKGDEVTAFNASAETDLVLQTIGFKTQRYGPDRSIYCSYVTNIQMTVRLTSPVLRIADVAPPGSCVQNGLITAANIFYRNLIENQQRRFDEFAKILAQQISNSGWIPTNTDEARNMFLSRFSLLLPKLYQDSANIIGSVYSPDINERATDGAHKSCPDFKTKMQQILKKAE
jgi:hypothetical protein